MLLDIIQRGQSAQVSYWAQDGKTHIKEFTIPQSEFFNWSRLKPSGWKNDDTSTNWDGKSCYKKYLDPDNWKDKLADTRLYEIVETLLPEDVKQDVYSYSIPNIWFCDIETEVIDGFPNPESAKERITCIGLCTGANVVVLGWNDIPSNFINNIQKRIDDHCTQSNIKREYTFKYTKYEDETAMLQAFMGHIVPRIPMLTGWNFLGFDWPYIMQRCVNLGIKTDKASPVGKFDHYSNRPIHVGLFDYLDAYKQWTHNTNENFKLDTIGEKLTGIKKVIHSETLQDMYENNFEKYIFYNAIDCILVQMIHETCHALDIGLTTAWLTKTQAMQCGSRTAMIKNMTRVGFEEVGRHLVSDRLANDKGETYEGAFVKDPIRGLHRNCICNDFASLYPSIMRQFNISPESYVERIYTEITDEIRETYWKKGMYITANGTVYTTEESVLNRILTRLYAQRKDYKKTSFKHKVLYSDAKKLKQLPDIISFLKKHDAYNVDTDARQQLEEFITDNYNKYLEYDNYQNGTKVLINATYGAFGFDKFYFYNRDMAESITTQGKDAILYANKLSDEYFMNNWVHDEETHKKMGINMKPGAAVMQSCIVYDDTDSLIFDSNIYVSENVIKLTINGKHICFNEDDDVCITRDGVVLNIKAKDIKESDMIQLETSTSSPIHSIEKTNTITIEELYNLGSTSMGVTHQGHESVNCDFKVLNIIDNTPEYNEVARVIRHKVTKPKWEVVDTFGNAVIMTQDHSAMVLRDSNLMKIKPSEINVNDDLLVSIDGNSVKFNNITKCECIGEFENEYVYDIEMNDESHTFVANNILVHNSQYTSLEQLINSSNWMDFPVWRLSIEDTITGYKKLKYVSSARYSDESMAKNYFNFDTLNFDMNTITLDQIEPNGREFALAFDVALYKQFFVDAFEKYAKKFHTANMMNFELESYSDAGIWLAKKKYVKNMMWAEPDVYYDNLTKIEPKGIELAQTASSPWVKTKLLYLIKWIFAQKQFSLQLFIKELKKIKKEFDIQSIDNISLNRGMNKYSKYVVSDTDKIIIEPHATSAVQGAAFWNCLLNKYPPFKKKYGTLVDSDKLCYVYVKQNHYKWYNNTPKGLEETDCLVLAYPSGEMPLDVISTCGLEVDRNRMFMLLLLDPLNRMIESMGFPRLSVDFMRVTSLF